MASSLKNIGKIFLKTKKNETVENKTRDRKEKILILKLGSTGEPVAVLQKALKDLDFSPGKIDGDFGLKTELAVEKFQNKSNILVDGIVGPGTIHEIDIQLSKLNLPVSNLAVSIQTSFNTSSKKIRWIKCPADIFPGRGGYGSLTLRADVAKAYKDLYDDVHTMGGIITTAGGKRPLTSKTSPSRSKKSMHYVGLAFDLALPTGMQNHNSDPYIITDQGNRDWEVWCRTEDPSVPVITLEAVTVSTKSGKTAISKKDVTGRFFSFTELANHHGFKPIRARKSFFRGGSYTGAEWWHFQWEKGLTKGSSSFGEELLKLYPLDRCEKFHYWNQVKNCVFGIDWF